METLLYHCVVIIIIILSSNASMDLLFMICIFLIYVGS